MIIYIKYYNNNFISLVIPHVDTSLTAFKTVNFNYNCKLFLRVRYCRANKNTCVIQ